MADTAIECKAANVACFVKQLGSNPRWVSPDGIGSVLEISGIYDRKGGNMSEWPADLRVREYPK